MTTPKKNPKTSETAHNLSPSKNRAKAHVAAATASSPKLNLHRNLGIALLTMGATIAASSPAHAATQTWTTGTGAGDGNWTSTGNWLSGTAPVSGTDSVVFGATTGTTGINYNVAGSAGTWAGITFNSGTQAYTITSGTMAMTGGASITNNSTVTQTINSDIINNSFIVAGAGNVTLGGGIYKVTSQPTITMNGTGLLTLTGSTNNGTNGTLAPALVVNNGTISLSKNAGLISSSYITLNAGTIKLGVSDQLRATLSVAFNGGTFDLNGCDTSAVSSGTATGSTGGFALLAGVGGRITNSGTGSGTNWAVIGNYLTNNNGVYGNYGGTISDGATAKVGVSLQQSGNSGGFHVLSGSNNYSGGTIINNTYGTANDRVTTLSVGNVASIGSSGNRKLTFVGTTAGNVDVSFQLTGTTITNSNQFDALTFANGGAAIDVADPNNTFTLGNNASGAAISLGGAMAFQKMGAGTLVITSGSVAYTGATNLVGGTLKIDAQNGGSLASTSGLNLYGGSLYLLGKNTGTTTQTLGAVSLGTLINLTTGGASTITVDANGGGGDDAGVGKPSQLHHGWLHPEYQGEYFRNRNHNEHHLDQRFDRRCKRRGAHPILGCQRQCRFRQHQWQHAERSSGSYLHRRPGQYCHGKL